MAMETHRLGRSRSRLTAGIIIAVVIIAIAGVWIYLATRPSMAQVAMRDVVRHVPVRGEATVPPSARADIMLPYPAPVESVAVSLGDRVSRGEVIVKLSYPSASLAQERAKQSLDEAERDYANSRLDYDRRIAEARQVLAQAKKSAATQTSASSAGAEPLRDVASPAGTGAENEPTASTETEPSPTGEAPESVSDARQNLLYLQAERDDVLSRLRDQVAAARASYRAAGAGEQMAELRSPIAGTVLVLNAQPGEETGGGRDRLVATVVDLSRVQIQAQLSDDQASELKRGQTATLTFAELRSTPLRGEVSRITTVAGSTLGLLRQGHVAVIGFSNRSGQVKPGMKADLAIKVAEAPRVLAVPNGAVRADGTGLPVVNVLRGSKWQPVVVTPGLRGDRFTEIKSGLKRGDVVQVVPV